MADDDSFDEKLNMFGALSLDDCAAAMAQSPPVGQPTPTVFLTDIPSSNMKDGECILVGGATTAYLFKLVLGGSLAGRTGPLLTAHLLAVSQKDGRIVEKLIEDGLKGADAVEFVGGEASMRLVLLTAGRGAPWRIRFAVSDPTSGEILCSCDMPVRAFSKRHKVDAVLASPDPLSDGALGARGAPVHHAVAVLPPTGQAAVCVVPAGLPRSTLAALSAAESQEPPHFERRVDGVEAEVAAAFSRALGAEAMAARPLQESDIEYLRRSVAALAGGRDAARAWLARTAAEVAKISRLWTAANPRLIAGFVSKEEAEEGLSGCEPGTFVLRFSAGEAGELVLAYVQESGGGAVAHCYVRSEGEALDEAVVVERLLSAPQLRSVYDIAAETVASKDLFRARGRYRGVLAEL